MPRLTFFLLFLCFLASCVDTPTREDLYRNIDYSKLVSIATIDVASVAKAQQALEAGGVPVFFEGMGPFSIFVPADQKDRAIDLLKADATRLGYAISF